MIVDSTDGYIFISEGSSKGLAVFKTDGTYVETLYSGDVVQGIALNGGTLYAADVTQDAVEVINAAATTPAQTATWSLGTSTNPYSVAVQSGKLWVSYGAAPFASIGDFDLSTGTFQAAGTVSAYSWYYAPELASDPNDTGVLVASDEGLSAATVGTYNTSTAPAASVAGPHAMTTATQDYCDNGQQAAVVPGGASFVLTCGAPYEGLVLSATATTSNLLPPVATLPAEPYPGAAAVASDGSVAIGTVNGVTQNIYLYGSDLTQHNVLSVPGLVAKGVAWGADSSTLYAVSGSSGSYTLHVFDSPELAKTALSLSGTGTSFIGSTVSLTGKLTFASGVGASGFTVSVARHNPDGSTTQLPSKQTDSNGAFTVSDTPPGVGAYSYTASYAGTSSIAASNATAAVTVTLVTATIHVTGKTVIPLAGYTVTGSLSFGVGAPAVATPLKVTRKNPNGTTTAVTGVATTDAAGDFSFAQPAESALGAYAYTVSYAGNATTAPATGTATVTVAKGAAPLTVSTGHKTVGYNSTITVTAHLGSTLAGSNRTVSISASFPGSRTVKLLKTGKVNSAGNLVVSFAGAVRNVNFSATYAGDTQYNKTTVTAKVGVQVRISMTNSGWYTTATTSGILYHLYHIGKRVNYNVTVTPNKSGECVAFEIDYLYNNAWTPDFTSPCFALTSLSALGAYLDTTGSTAGMFRTRAIFAPSSKDVTNVTSYSGWFYFQLTT
jgi:hypothetical protein